MDCEVDETGWKHLAQSSQNPSLSLGRKAGETDVEYRIRTETDHGWRDRPEAFGQPGRSLRRFHPGCR